MSLAEVAREDQQDGAGEALAHRTADGFAGARASPGQQLPLELANPCRQGLSLAPSACIPLRWGLGQPDCSGMVEPRRLLRQQWRSCLFNCWGAPTASWVRRDAWLARVPAGGQHVPAAAAGSGGARLDAGAAAGGPGYCRAPPAGARPHLGSLPGPLGAVASQRSDATHWNAMH